MKPTVKFAIAVIVLGVIGFCIFKMTSPWSRRQDLAKALKMAGFKEDKAGRIILSSDDAGLSLAFDPNSHDPTIGFRNCVSWVNACSEARNQLDSCINDSHRCVSSTPWKGDPAGDDCCPGSCVDEYHELRRTKAEIPAFMGMVRGTCYPGMKEIFSGKKP